MFFRKKPLERYLNKARKGSAEAQFMVGRLYEIGKGVPQNYVEAVYWYSESAKQGHRDGQNALAAMYHCGHGVPQDYIEAHKWYNLAAAQSDHFEYQAIAKYRNAVEDKMTREEVVQAHLLARDWRPERFRDRTRLV